MIHSFAPCGRRQARPRKRWDQDYTDYIHAAAPDGDAHWRDMATHTHMGFIRSPWSQRRKPWRPNSLHLTRAQLYACPVCRSRQEGKCHGGRPDCRLIHLMPLLTTRYQVAVVNLSGHRDVATQPASSPGVEKMTSRIAPRPASGKRHPATPCTALHSMQGAHSCSCNNELQRF